MLLLFVINIKLLLILSLLLLLFRCSYTTCCCSIIVTVLNLYYIFIYTVCIFSVSIRSKKIQIAFGLNIPNSLTLEIINK